MKSLKFTLTIFVFTACANMIFAQDHMHHHHSNMSSKKDTTKVENIIREGNIELNNIDINKDGKVFQCPMDWNVISDDAGKCPKCKMSLVEVTTQKAKDKLTKHGFKVK